MTSSVRLIVVINFNEVRICYSHQVPFHIPAVKPLPVFSLEQYWRESASAIAGLMIKASMLKATSTRVRRLNIAFISDCNIRTELFGGGLRHTTRITSL